MRIPAMRGVIDRRILANYAVDPEVMARLLPEPFRPKVIGGRAVGGICLIRLVDLKPPWVPLPCGLRSENAAHRIAVEWDEDGVTREGVFIPRRDTDSRWNVLAGGRLFPGVHHAARFAVSEEDDHLSVSMRSLDGEARVEVEGRVTDRLPEGSVFGTLAEASRFFERGSLGYSTRREPGRFDGIELCCEGWAADALAVEHAASSWFDDRERFPRGTVTFDCALLMRGIRHAWRGRRDLCCPSAAPA